MFIEALSENLWFMQIKEVLVIKLQLNGFSYELPKKNTFQSKRKYYLIKISSHNFITN
jgi:hypothetical protein